MILINENVGTMNRDSSVCFNSHHCHPTLSTYAPTSKVGRQTKDQNSGLFEKVHYPEVPPRSFECKFSAYGNTCMRPFYNPRPPSLPDTRRVSTSGSQDVIPATKKPDPENDCDVDHFISASNTFGQALHLSASSVCCSEGTWRTNRRFASPDESTRGWIPLSCQPVAW